MKNIDFAINLIDLYSKHGFNLYLVGGSVRDYLLFNDFDDFDFATNALVEDGRKILNTNNFDSFSSQFGTLKTIYENKEIEITTFRKEGNYLDGRRPSYIEFIDDLNIDAKRRDFTINALYLDKEKNIFDPFFGKEDLKNKIIRMIGDPYIRLKEDPLRIIRALRFALKLNFQIETSLETAIFDLKHLVETISYARLSLEINKILKYHSKKDIQYFFDKYNLNIKISKYIV